MPGGSPPEFWIQLENHAWDVSPNNIDRMMGQTIQQETAKTPEVKTLKSPATGVQHDQTMFNALNGDALILRRYTENWAVPDDRKVNPWDQNEPDPTDTGTMGTIPGPVIECNVGDTVLVHFRNADNRTVTISGTAVPFPIEKRIHSLHPHGFVFAPTSDGAYPLSPPDPNQPIDAGETLAWAKVGVTGFKQGDRVPPGGTFTYTWETHGWPSTAGVWLYHDHSICDDENIGQGAIGIVVIHNPQDPQDVLTQDLPDNSPFGNPIHFVCFPFPNLLPIEQQDLAGLKAEAMGGFPGTPMVAGTPGKTGAASMADMQGMGAITGVNPGGGPAPQAPANAPATVGPPTARHTVKHGDIIFELDDKLQSIARFCLPLYQSPPGKAQYLLLFHTLGNAGMCINGCKFMGNTPTLVSGPNTLMRFGVVGMMDDFHTFHLHGHRWVISGPDGTTPNEIQSSIQKRAVSQFEDTRTFGPANSFSFTIQQDQGSFMGAFPNTALGEWHMHCHVQSHMADGMMGTLKIVAGGELALGFPVGTPCPPLPTAVPPGGGGGGTGTANNVIMQNTAFDPDKITISKGQTVTWTNKEADQHTVTSNPGAHGCQPPSAESFSSPTLSQNQVFSHTFNVTGTFPYHCEKHACFMSGTVTVVE